MPRCSGPILGCFSLRCVPPVGEGTLVILCDLGVGGAGIGMAGAVVAVASPTTGPGRSTPGATEEVEEPESSP